MGQNADSERRDCQLTFGHTVPKSEKCSYVWALEMFEDIGSQNENAEIKSTIFSSEGGCCKWILGLMPYDKTEVAQRVIVQLRCSEPRTADLKSYKGSCTFMNSQRSISPGRQFVGYTNVNYPHFIVNSIERQQLLNKLDDGVLRIQIKITSILKETSTSSSLDVKENHQPEDMLTLLRSKEFSDFTVVVDGTAFPVHKCVLAARSPVFKAMLKSGSVETQLESMDIHEFEEATVKALLDFMYSGDLEDINDYSLVVDLLRAADMYQISDLVKHCSRHLRAILNFSNVFEICSVADKYNAPELLEKCLQFISEHKNEVKLLQEQKDMLENNGSLLLAIVTGLL